MPPMSQQGREYWRSLEDLANTPEFRERMENEFPAGALEILDTDRRQFLKLMGASMALAGIGLAGCRRWPKEHIVPLSYRPEDRDPGVAETYASTREFRGVGVGVLVVSSDGRPTKVEGNPLHPTSLGASDAWTQASILDMYDQDRSRAVRHNGAASTWADFAAWAEEHFSRMRGANGGSGVYVLSEATNSPSVMRMRDRLKQAMPNLTWLEYEAVSDDAELEGTRKVFGKPCRAIYHLDKAQVVLSLDADFFSTHPAAVRMMRDWAKTRRAEENGGAMSRLYMAEGVLSLTGANADERLAIRASAVPGLAGRIAAGLLGDAFARHAKSSDARVEAFVDNVVNDLRNHRGHSLVIAGAGQPAEVHALAHLLNESLGNVGATVDYVAMPDRPTHAQAITQLARDLEAGAVSTLIMLGTNPVLTAPADLDFSTKLAKAKAVVHLSDAVDETSSHANCHWHLNRAHYLEAWGDARGHDGTYSITQPLILPLFGGKTPAEVLAVVAGAEVTNSYDITRQTFFALTGLSNDENAWRKALHDGVVKDTAWPVETNITSRMPAGELANQLSPLGASEGMELVLRPSTALFDGRFANNGWLQELPEPITKLVWDNAALMSPALGERLGVENGDMVRITRGSRSIDAPVMIVPGMASDCVDLALGYGRPNAGRIAKGAGVNAYPLRTTDAMYAVPGVTLTKTGDSMKLATTQDHHSMTTKGVGAKGVQERLPTIFREANLSEYHEHPDFAKHRAHVSHRLNIWKTDLLAGGEYAWAMAIDLSTCTGCSACVVACQAENNVPIVGKDQILRGREMHWIRIDRYFSFGKNGDGYDVNDVRAVALQPVTCMHCENAPCEQVCPVAATVHDTQGLNVMVYNRCVGTRYCSNNCPYKVRRFNYYDWHKRGPQREQPGVLLQVEPEYYIKGQAEAEPLKQMQFNPEVTVRSRGVMEKCSYCVQRIEKARIAAKNKWVQTPADERPARVTIEDSQVVPACAQACPSDAIIFGDQNNPKSRVVEMIKRDRSYELLEELNTKPRTRYLAKLRNPASASSASGGGHEHPNGSSEAHG